MIVIKLKKSKCLIHNYSNFTEEHIACEANSIGIRNKNILENNIWIYEMFSQIQKYSNKRCVLKGGACAQVYIPYEEQRCTEDLDIYTDLSENKLKLILSTIEQRFKQNKVHIYVYEYIPKKVLESGKTIPLTTLMVDIPFIFKGNKNMHTRNLKIDFLHTDINKLHICNINKPKILGLQLNYSPLSISPHSIIGDKLLTFAVHSVGIQSSKTDKFYKNIYDLFYLINNNDTTALIKVSELIKNSISLEIKIKKIKSINLSEVLDDILNQLYEISIIDLNINYIGFSKRFESFEKNYIQANIRYMLNSDTWSMMCMYIYLWTYALKHYISNDKDCSKLKHINNIIDEYNNYNNLNSHEKNDYINNIKYKINEKNEKLFLNLVENPLRLIYLNYIIYKIKPLNTEDTEKNAGQH